MSFKSALPQGATVLVSNLRRPEARPLGIVRSLQMWGDSNNTYTSPKATTTRFLQPIPRMLPRRTLNWIFRTSSVFSRPIPNRTVPDISIGRLVRTHLDLKRTMATAMGKRLEGKTIIVTGASSGIGRSTAMEFARTSPKNLKLILTARRVDKLQEIAEEIKKDVGDGVKVLPMKLDVSNPVEVKGFVDSLPAEFRDIDVLVNNAYVHAQSLLRLKKTDDFQMQWTRQRHRQSARDSGRRYQCHVRHQRCGPRQHDSGHPTNLQKARSGWRARGHHQHWQYSRQGSVSWREHLLRDESGGAELHRCAAKGAHRHADKGHRD